MSLCKPSCKANQRVLWGGEHPHLGSLICFRAQARVFQESAQTTVTPSCRSLLDCCSSTFHELNPHWHLARIKKAIAPCKYTRTRKQTMGSLCYIGIFSSDTGGFGLLHHRLYAPLWGEEHYTLFLGLLHVVSTVCCQNSHFCFCNEHVNKLNQIFWCKRYILLINWKLVSQLRSFILART